MAEYIERKKLIEHLKKDPLFDIVERYGITGVIESIPAADVRPVVRGHWITEEEAEAKGDYSLRDACSVCGRCDWDCTESASFNYCPNCGADMREES